MTGWVKLLLELGPLAVFFVVFTVLAPADVTPEQLTTEQGVQMVEAVAADPLSAALTPDERMVKAKEKLRFELELDALIWATVAFMVALVVSLIITYKIDGSISKVAMLTAAIVFVTGALTIILHNELFVKIKPTIAYGIFGVVLLFGWMRNKSYLQIFMKEIADIDDKGWLKLARNWGLFFIFAALLNEVIWRNFDTQTWVNAKTFVYLPLIAGFAISQAPIMAAHEKQPSEDGGKVGAKS